MSFQAIVTKFHGPTNTQGARISAKASAGRIITHYDYGMGQAENHARAARLLAEKMGWGGHWVVGGMPSEDGDVFVCVVENDERFTLGTWASRAELSTIA